MITQPNPKSDPVSDDLLVNAAAILSDVFIAPPSESMIAANAQPAALETLRQIGAALGAQAVADQLFEILSGSPSDRLAIELQRSYTRLFEGVFPRETASPYESHWRAPGGQAVAAMNEALRALDIRVNAQCREPIDHISIQLSTFAAALLNGRRDIATEIADNLSVWVPAFSAAIVQRDQTAFYANQAALLNAFVTAARVHSHSHSTSPTMPQREGEDA